MTTTKEVRRRLGRLGERELATNDPLMAEIMIAHTLSNLAIAEALNAQNEIISKAPIEGAIYSTFYPHKSKDSIFAEVANRLLSTLNELVAVLRNLRR